MRTLKIGVKGDDVRAWQSYLQVPATGEFDEETKRATAEFQKKNRLEVDGKMGRLTHAKAISLGFVDAEQPAVAPLVDLVPTTPGEFHLSAGSLARLEGVQEPRRSTSRSSRGCGPWSVRSNCSPRARPRP